MSGVGRLCSSDRRSFKSVTATLNAARSFVMNFVREAGGDDDAVTKAELIASELASNAIRATAETTYDVAVEARCGPAVVIEVGNVGDGVPMPDRADWRPDNVLASTGRGLQIVERLADAVDVFESDRTVTVRARLAL